MPAARATKLEPLDTTAEVETPEQVRFHYQLAGPARRAMAYLLDLLVRGGIVLLFVWVAGLGRLLSDTGEGGLGTGLVLLVVFVLEWGYYVACETLMGGRSLGKRALGLRVVKQGGQPLAFADSVLRNLLRAADVLPMFYAAGVIVMGFDPLFRRLGDLVAGTVVVAEQRQVIEGSVTLVGIQLTPKELNQVPDKLVLFPGELEAVEIFLRRRERLSPAREAELADMIAPLLAKRFSARYSDPVRFLAALWVRATRRGSA